MSNLLSQASLVMIPSGYKEDVVYSQIPTSGAGDLSFTRASNGTRINSAGLVEVVAWNLLRYSEDFTNAVYSKFNSITATADQATAPNGTTTADKIGLSTASTTFPNLAQDAQYIGGQVYTFVVYLKKNTVNFGKIRVGGTAFASSTNSPIFNLNTGVLVSGTGTIENVGNGWYRCSMTATADTSAAGGFAIDLPDSAGVWNGSSVYNVNDSIFAWGFMSNIGSTAKPYFPTTDRLNVPRLTYQNGGGGCPSLLLEPQRTNLALQSEAFDNASWTKTAVSITANTTTSPDGNTNADTFTGDGTSSIKNLIQTSTSTLTSGVRYCTSVYVKKNTNNFFQIIGTASAYSSGTFANFDLNNGVVGTIGGSGTEANIVNVGNGWYRCTMIATTNNTSGANIAIFGLITSATSARVEVNTLSTSVYIWGAQIEASSYATSYIPTTSSSATRVADACFKTGISSLIGQSQGTMFVDSVLTHSATTNEYLIQVSESASNRFFIYREAGTNKLGCFARVGSTTIYTQLTSGAITGRVKAVFTYQSGSFAFYVNGTQIGVSTATFSTPPTMDRLDIDSNAGAENGYYNYNEAILFKTRLTNAELQAITTI